MERAASCSNKVGVQGSSLLWGNGNGRCWTPTSGSMGSAPCMDLRTQKAHARMSLLSQPVYVSGSYQARREPRIVWRRCWMRTSCTTWRMETRFRFRNSAGVCSLYLDRYPPSSRAKKKRDKDQYATTGRITIMNLSGTPKSRGCTGLSMHEGML